MIFEWHVCTNQLGYLEWPLWYGVWLLLTCKIIYQCLA